MKTEKVKKGSDWNNTSLCDFINSITDDDNEFKGDYEITWDIQKHSQKTEKSKEMRKLIKEQKEDALRISGGKDGMQ